METNQRVSRREAILDAAEELFVERGFAAIAISEIAQKADVTKSLIHHHFGSKQELWDAVKKRSFEGYVEKQGRLLEQSEPSKELLRESFQGYYDYLKENPSLVRLFSWTLAEGDVDSVGKVLAGPGVEMLRKGCGEGSIRKDVEPINILRIGIGMITHWFQARDQFLAWEDPEESDHGVDVDRQFLDNFLTIFLDGLTPPATEEKK
jgi:TetR/AcrR family transcriptional regulator